MSEVMHVIIEKRRLIRLGATYYISIPKDWFKVHKIDPDAINKLLMVVGKDIKIVNPDHEQEVYEDMSKIAKQVRP